VPRGCWHVALPLNEPSLHLTISVSNPTLSEILAWVVEELRRSEIGRVDVSRLSEKSEQEQFVHFAQRVVRESVSADLLDRYFRAADSLRRPLAHLSIPWNAATPALLPGGETSYQLTGRRELRLDDTEQSGILEFSYNNARWRFPNLIGPVLKALHDGGSHSFSELVNQTKPDLDEVSVRAFLFILVSEGLLRISASSDSCTSKDR
jgi:hypothetical protein